jgi:hypothetical protein
MRLITVVGKWNVIELEDTVPKEYAVTDNENLYHNRNEAAAIRLAEFLSRNDPPEGKELQEA